MERPIGKSDFLHNPEVLSRFAQLDDFDIFSAIKVWSGDEDPVLSELCRCLVNRILFRIEMQKEPFDPAYVDKIKSEVMKGLSVSPDHLDYFVVTDSTSNYTYDPVDETIRIMLKNGRVIDFTEASEEFDLTVLTRPVTKYILGYPKRFLLVDN